MEGFKQQKKVACFKEGGQVKYESRRERVEEEKADIKQDKAIVKKGVAQHESALHKGEPKTELKLKCGGRAKKKGGTVRKYAAGGVIDRLKENVLGTPEQNEAAMSSLDKTAKGPGISGAIERTIRGGLNMPITTPKAKTAPMPTGVVSDMERKGYTAKKKGGKC